MQRLSEHIAAEIQAKILNEEYQEGERLLSELELAEKHKVSRSVIRESLRQLEGLGLVKIKKGPAGGIFVSNGYHKPFHDSIRALVESGQVSEDNVFDIRLLLETYATAEAAKNADEQDIRYLQSLLQIPAEKLDDPEWLQKNRSRFHLGLAEAAKNPILVVLMRGLIQLLRKYFHDFHDVHFERHSLDTYKKILHCIQMQSSDEARKLMRDYILKMREYMQKTESNRRV